MAKRKYNDDRDVTFNIINKNTVERLQRDGKVDVPAKKVDVPKDKRWNEKQMGSKILQGIQNGDSVQKMAESMKDVVGNNANSAVRQVRTMVTSAECNGRLDSFRSLAARGVILKKVWIATPDHRTRESHLEIDGQEAEIEDRFTNGCMYPGDAKAPPEEVWNCRCSMRSHILGVRARDGSIIQNDVDREQTSHDRQMDAEKDRREKEKNAPKLVKTRATRRTNKSAEKPDSTGPFAGVRKQNKTSASAVAKATNPHYNDDNDYRINCANCAVAVEARSRGYDVTALARVHTRGNNIPNFYYDGRTGKGSWYDSFEGGIKPVSAKATRKNNSADAVRQIMTTYGDGSRAVVYIKWDGKTVGHYFNAINKKGNIIFVDGQNGKTGKDVENYFKSAKPSSIMIFRTDDKKFTDYILKVVKPNDEK